VLIFLGGAYLMHEFDLIPDFHIHRLWPVFIIAIGIGLIIKGQQKQPWEEPNWQNPGNDTTKANEATTTTTNPSTDNTPTV